MIKNKILEQKFNEAAADFTITTYGRCEHFNDNTTINEAVFILGTDSRICNSCKKASECEIRNGFHDFRAGASWLLDVVAKNLAEAFLMEQM